MSDTRNLNPDALGDLYEALDDLLNSSGAREHYSPLLYADAVEKAEAALAKASDRG